MSGVFEKDRSESELDYFELARKIWAEVVRLVRNEKDVPKSYRFLIGVPTAETARSMVANINRAYHFYPSSSFNVLERRRYLTLAIADCEQILLDMQCMKDVGLPINVNRLENLIKMAEAEIDVSYQSWRGGMRGLDAHGTVLSMDALYRELFGQENQTGGVLTDREP